MMLISKGVIIHDVCDEFKFNAKAAGFRLFAAGVLCDANSCPFV